MRRREKNVKNLKEVRGAKGKGVGRVQGAAGYGAGRALVR